MSPSSKKRAEFRDRLRERQLTFGSWLQMGSPEVAEIMASKGFDWLVADLEHGSVDRSTLVALVRAIEGRGLIPLARIMACDPLLSRQSLDAGCVGVIIPHVESALTFESFVRASTWPPNGSRSIGFFRANDYGLSFDEYALEAKDPVFIPMIESVAGVENVEAIVSSGHADAVFIGPYDLSASVGTPGDFGSSAFREAEEHVLQICMRLGVSLGIHDVDPSEETISNYVERGFNFIACGMDTVFLSRAVGKISKFGIVQSSQLE